MIRKEFKFIYTVDDHHFRSTHKLGNDVELVFVSMIGLTISIIWFSSDTSSDLNFAINSTPFMLVLLQAETSLFKLLYVEAIISKVFSH